MMLSSRAQAHVHKHTHMCTHALVYCIPDSDPRYQIKPARGDSILALHASLQVFAYSLMTNDRLVDRRSSLDTNSQRRTSLHMQDNRLQQLREDRRSVYASKNIAAVYRYETRLSVRGSATVRIINCIRSFVTLETAITAINTWMAAVKFAPSAAAIHSQHDAVRRSRREKRQSPLSDVTASSSTAFFTSLNYQ
jgi:hypothetical protein